MKSGFFERRKILKGINSLDLTPVKLVGSEMNDNGRVDILLPRFKSTFVKRALQSKKKGEFIRIHLDEMGSLIWSNINGSTKVHELCRELTRSHPEKLNPPEETEERVSKFLSLLYQERYITFRELS